MPIIIFLIFVIVPLTEIALFVVVGQQVGVLATIALVILTALLGTMLLNRQGLSVLAEAQQALKEGRPPVDSVINGMFLFVAGALLLTPGLLTDAVGFLLFVPFIRRWIAQFLVRKLVKSRGVQFDIFTDQDFDQPDMARKGPGNRAGGPIIDGEFSEKTDRPTVPNHPAANENNANGTTQPKKPDDSETPWRV